MNHKEKLNYLVAHAPANIDLCAAAFTVISEAPEAEQPDLLKEFLIGFQNAPTDGSLDLPEIMDSKKLFVVMYAYGNKIDSRLEEIQEPSPTETAFYADLWDYIRNDPELFSRELRAFALWNIAIDKRIPYYQIDRSAMLSMPDTAFQHIADTIGDDTFGKMAYILGSTFQQKSQPASLIFQLMDSLPDDLQKTAFLGRLIDYYEDQILSMHLTELLSEDDDEK